VQPPSCPNRRFFQHRQRRVVGGGARGDGSRLDSQHILIASINGGTTAAPRCASEFAVKIGSGYRGGCGPILALRTPLAPRRDRGGIDFFVVGTLHEIDNAVAPHQVTGRDEGVFFRCKSATNTIAVQSTIKIVRGPAHAVLVRPPERAGPRQACSLFDLEIYRRFLAAAALNFIFHDLPFVE
jgi:hypothetical protein